MASTDEEDEEDEFTVRIDDELELCRLCDGWKDSFGELVRIELIEKLDLRCRFDVREKKEEDEDEDEVEMAEDGREDERHDEFTDENDILMLYWVLSS